MVHLLISGLKKPLFGARTWTTINATTMRRGWRSRCMKRAIVVVEPTKQGRRLVDIAGEIAAGTGAELLLVRLIDESEYRSDLERKAQSSQDIEQIDDLIERAQQTAADLGQEGLEDRDVTYEARGIVGSLPDDLLRVAEQDSCDHLFIVGDRRSPTGKAIFGDTTQAVLLNFDGPVTSLIGLS